MVENQEGIVAQENIVTKIRMVTKRLNNICDDINNGKKYSKNELKAMGDYLSKVVSGIPEYRDVIEYKAALEEEQRWRENQARIRDERINAEADVHEKSLRYEYDSKSQSEYARLQAMKEESRRLEEQAAKHSTAEDDSLRHFRLYGKNGSYQYRDDPYRDNNIPLQKDDDIEAKLNRVLNGESLPAAETRPININALRMERPPVYEERRSYGDDIRDYRYDDENDPVERTMEAEVVSMSEQKAAKESRDMYMDNDQIPNPATETNTDIPVKKSKENSPAEATDDPKTKKQVFTAPEKQDTPDDPSGPSEPDNKKDEKKKKKWPLYVGIALLILGLAIAGYLSSHMDMFTNQSAPVETPVVSEVEPTVEPTPESTPTPTPTPEATETPEGEEQTVERTEPLGSSGRLYFDNGWSVALNYADSYDTNAAQENADAWDSACYMEDSGKVMIADHASQGFDVIKNYPVGSTAVIVDADGKEHKIVCTAYYDNAYWEDGYTHLPDGRGIWGASDGQIGLQTANNVDGSSVTVSYWNYVEE